MSEKFNYEKSNRTHIDQQTNQVTINEGDYLCVTIKTKKHLGYDTTVDCSDSQLVDVTYPKDQNPNESGYVLETFIFSIKGDGTQLFKWYEYCPWEQTGQHILWFCPWEQSEHNLLWKLIVNIKN